MDNVKMFHWADYTLFGLTLLVSLLIGVYYAVQMKRKKIESSADEMLVGGRTQGVIPVALSLFVTFMSPVGIMGTAAEVYTFGGMFWVQIIGMFLITPISFNIILPIYHRLELTSAYEYIDLRFNKTIGLMFTVAFIPQMISYIAMVLYAPSLAISQVTGLSLWMSIIVGGLVCTAYTSIGGMRAVIWSDVFQAAVMVVGLVVICIFGTVTAGGLGRVLEIAKQGDRMPYFEFDTDPLRRTSFWSLNLGALFITLSLESTNQAVLQRCFSIGNLRDAKLSAWLNKVLYIIFLSLQCFSGLIAYAHYHDCDPMLQGRISQRDQLFPLLVMDLFHDLPGIPGLFLSCLLSAALSTVSSGLNSIAAVLLKDICQPLYRRFKKREMPGNLAVKLTMLIVVTLGLVNVGIALSFQAASVMVIQLADTLWSIAGGAMGGVVVMAVFLPFCNSWGAGAGFVAGSLAVAWLSIGGLFVHLSAPYLDVSDIGCNATGSSSTTWNATWGTTVNATLVPMANMVSNSTQDIAWTRTIYGISYHYYSVIGTVLTVAVGIVISAITGCNSSREVDPRLYYHIAWPFCCSKRKADRGYEMAVKADNQLPEDEYVKESAPLREEDN